MIAKFILEMIKRIKEQISTKKYHKNIEKKKGKKNK